MTTRMRRSFFCFGNAAKRWETKKSYARYLPFALAVANISHMTNTTKNIIKTAIALSIATNSIVHIDAGPDVIDALMAYYDDEAEHADMLECWGTDDGNDWRIHAHLVDTYACAITLALHSWIDDPTGCLVVTAAELIRQGRGTVAELRDAWREATEDYEAERVA